jgi:hypothetical protein
MPEIQELAVTETAPEGVLLPQTAPSVGEVTAEIAADARHDATRYLEDTVVPHGGE